MRARLLLAIASVVAVACTDAPISTPSGPSRALPIQVTYVPTDMSGAPVVVAAGDSVVITATHPFVCGTESTSAVLARGVVIATIVESSLFDVACTYQAGYPGGIRLAIADVPAGLHLVVLDVVHQTLGAQGKPVGSSSRTVLTRQLVRLP